MRFFDSSTLPSSVVAYTGDRTIPLQGSPWSAGDLTVLTQPEKNGMKISIHADSTPLTLIRLRWQAPVSGNLRFLGDHWERSYGDLEWRGLRPERIMPWYFLCCDGQTTDGYGVKTQPAALCFWTVDSAGVSLWLDVRCGGGPVELRGRTLEAATLVVRPGLGEEETPFAAARAFCKQLCDHPRLPDHPVYGSNNWYYAYGESSQAEILEDTHLLVDLAPTGANRPYMVIDDGWQPLCGDTKPHRLTVGGPYTGSNALFPDMADLADRIKKMGARPGIWLRPLAAYPTDSPSMLLPGTRVLDASASSGTVDPSLPEALERITADVQRMCAWGYELIKHDWSTCDLFGRWGFQMGAELTNPGWRFADTSRTTAEITLALYRAIRAGAGEAHHAASALIIGCNTIGHLGAGLFELQRIGDDTSGREWERTRKYGINTLAFRGPQHDTFFAVDADCMGHTPVMPWEMNERFLDLLARSGTPLFLSIDPKALGSDQIRAIRAAYQQASLPQPLAEPLDWLETTCPTTWKMDQTIVHYDWFGDNGVQPHASSIPIMAL
jgi:alpha-galactosidase